MDRTERLELASNYFIKNSELVELKTGSYEEITTHADQRTVLFKVKAKDTWSSIPLISTLKKGFVPGLKQKLVRLYDCQREAFTFQNTQVGNRLNVSQVLRSQPIWDGRDLTSMDVLDLCDQFIDQRLNNAGDYATTISKSLYPSDTPFDVNLKAMPNGLNHLKEGRKGLLGLSQGYSYLGTNWSFFPIHKEDADLISMNFAHENGGKLWFSIDRNDNQKFCNFLQEFSGVPVEENLWDILVERKCVCPYRHKFLWIHPIAIMAAGITVHWTLQEERELVTTPTGVFHYGFNISPNVHEAWNCTSQRWSRQNIDKTYCDCGVLTNPPRLAYDRVVDGIYLAKVVSEEKRIGKLKPVDEDADVLMNDPDETHEDSDASFHDDTEITAPGKPELVRLHHTVVEIKWTPSNSTTVHYKVEQSTPLSKNWRKADTKPYISSCKATINSLLPEKAYFFRVQTYRKRDLLAVGESSDLIRTGDAHPLPGPPTNLKFANGALTWDYPSDDGGSPVEGYLLSYRRHEGQPWMKIRAGGAVTKLTYRPYYDGQYCVFAETIAGVSLESAQCNVSLNPDQYGEPALPVSVKTGQSVATQTPGVAASESESEVQPELEAEAGSEPEAEAELQAETESELEAEAEVEAETESELEAEAEVESEPKLEAVETGDESTPPGQDSAADTVFASGNEADPLPSDSLPELRKVSTASSSTGSSSPPVISEHEPSSGDDPSHPISKADVDANISAHAESYSQASSQEVRKIEAEILDPNRPRVKMPHRKRKKYFPPINKKKFPVRRKTTDYLVHEPPQKKRKEEDSGE